MDNILKHLNDLGYRLNEGDKQLIQLSLMVHSEHDIIQALNNFMLKCTDKTKIDFLTNANQFKRWLNIDKVICDSHIRDLPPDKFQDILDCHDEIMFKCCGYLNKYHIKKHDRLLNKLYFFNSKIGIPFWVMSGVLYDKIDITRPLPGPDYLVSIMNNQENFNADCYNFYHKVKSFSKNKNYSHVIDMVVQGA